MDSCCAEYVKAALHEFATDALPAAIRMDHQMMNVSASAIMTCQDCPHSFPFSCGDKAHVRVAIKIDLEIPS